MAAVGTTRAGHPRGNHLWAGAAAAERNAVARAVPPSADPHAAIRKSVRVDCTVPNVTGVATQVLP